jgi:hypothetical protein
MFEKPGVPVTKIDRTRGHPFALAAVAVELGVMFVGAIMPTPLYPLYRMAFGFSGVTLTLIYAVYVLVLPAPLLSRWRTARRGFLQRGPSAASPQVLRQARRLPGLRNSIPAAVNVRRRASPPLRISSAALSDRCLAACWRNSRLGRFGCLFTSTF